ncbi:MAG: NAD(P)/FAD-dependent oxidoreductase [Myxococcota bacterium]|nr:NAD(P)/FAD-dependent oxidoreductase [Myxococcota bacterium]
MTLSQSYLRAAPTGDFDAILIGSGIGSLITGALLSKEGLRCLILERHYTPGGFTHTFKRGALEWDVGVHYIGEVMRPQSVLARLFDYVCDVPLEWADMGEVYDKIKIGDDVYPFRRGRAAFRAGLFEAFPKEEDQRAIDRYLALVTEAARAARGFFGEKALPGALRHVAGPMMRRPFLRSARQSTYDILSALTDNQRLIQVLTGQYGDYGLPPKRSSFAMHAMVVRHYLNGGAYPVGGSARFFETIAPTILKAGGEIFHRAEVSEILCERGRAVGVRLSNGSELFAPRVISGAGVATTQRRLLSDVNAPRSGLAPLLKKVPSSAAHLCLYLGLEGSPEALSLPRANWWAYPEGGDHDQLFERYLEDPQAPLPVLYASFPSAKDPSWEERVSGQSTVELITLADPRRFAPWAGGRWRKRGEDYDMLKAQLSEQLLKGLYALEPQLEGKVTFQELSTPLSTQHFCNYQDGEIYGLDHGPGRFEARGLRPATKLKGLYLTGQDVATAGVGGAMMGGLLCAAALLRRDLLSKVMRHG